MKIKDITTYLETWAPLSYQESYDNAGLLVGDPQSEVLGVLLTLDVTEAVIAEAKQTGCNLIVAHHPLIFKGLKKLTGSHWVEKCVIAAIQSNIAIYAIHTNLDAVISGVNDKIAEKLGLQSLRILSPKSNTLQKLVTFIPTENTTNVLDALYAAGAGQVGNYDRCSFRVGGVGTFRPLEAANPHLGEVNRDEEVNENRIELIFPSYLGRTIVATLKNAHPYEEVAYYLTDLANANQEIGSGIIGELEKPVATADFLKNLKKTMRTEVIRHTLPHRDQIQKVAVCGGAGSFLLSAAKAAGADVLVTADFKYHEFFEAEGKIIIADIGHYESEQFTKELLFDKLEKKFANIALRLSNVATNPIKYL